MASNLQSQAISIANAQMNMLNQLAALAGQTYFLTQQFTNLNLSSIFASLPTAPINPDGSFGTTDATPNPANPITNTSLNRALSLNDLNTLNTFLTTFMALMQGQQVAQQSAIPALQAKIFGT